MSVGAGYEDIQKFKGSFIVIKVKNSQSTHDEILSSVKSKRMKILKEEVHSAYRVCKVHVANKYLKYYE